MDFDTALNTIANAMGGDKEAAGTLIYIFILFFITALTCKKSLVLTLLIMMPITLLFSKMALLDDDLTILLIIISILGLALSTRQVLK